MGLVSPVVAFHDELMRSGDESQPVGVVERFRDVLSESIAGTTGGDAPPSSVIGVGPQQVTHGALNRQTQLINISNNSYNASCRTQKYKF